MGNILELQNISKSFKKKKVLDDISYSFCNGIYGLLGPNGAGKTTLMRCVVGLYKCGNGSVYYGEKKIDNIKEYGKIVGYLPQKFGLFKELTVADILRYFAGLKRIPEEKMEEEIKRCLQLVNLEEQRLIKCKKLSGGMIRRLGIAQAILGKPSIVIFDEPTTGLDPEARFRFKLLLKKIGQDTIVIVSTHIVEDVEAVCDNILIMNEGKIIEALSTKKIKEIAMEKVYEVPYCELEKISGDYFIEKQYEKDNEIYCRVLSAEKQIFSLLDPVVEDGYLCRIKNI